ncbi:MAG: single-stranded DNA-binding protein [Oscillospiraceae bacterium]|jgi:single-strand DNA-binding protein|nr:single-stranded DNA-binding protein [Oscillospiraceae bacterium]
MLNKIILMGRLTREPELRTTQSGISVTSFTLAVDRDFQRGEERQTDFIDIVAWRGTADFVHKYFRKGQLVAVAGRLQSRKWEDKEGNKRVSFEVVADEVHFAERKQDSPQAYGAQPSGAPPHRPQQDETPPFRLDAPATFAELDDDDGELPF